MKKLSFLMIAIILMNIGLVAFAQENITYNDTDICTLKNIYQETQNNVDIFDWDFSDPETIKEADWKRIEDKYYLYSLDLSNLTIDGDINLTNCLYLEECNFSNTDINSVQLPCSLKYISNKSFENCCKLQVITINADNTVIGSNAFSGCISLKSLVNAEKIASIGRNAFNNCVNLSFYFSDYSPNYYAEKYAVTNDIRIEKSILTNAYGYAGKINYKKMLRYNLNEFDFPYDVGNVSIYTNNKEFIETVNIDENGKFSFDNIVIGKKYRIVIDGKTAIPREEFFIPIGSNYCIASEENCFAIMICDYNRDGVFNSLDKFEFLSKFGSTYNDKEDSVYDFNRDGSINASDNSVFLLFYAQENERYTYN